MKNSFLLSAKDISLSFGLQTIFDKISFNINQNQKIGLVGRNGSGKTSLLRVLSYQQKIDDGQLFVQKGSKIAYMPQEVVLLSDKTVLDEAMSAIDGLGKLIEELKRLEKDLNENSHNQDKMERYAQIQHKLFECDYDRKKVEAEKILFGLCFTKEQIEESVEKLSVGWKMRLVLAKLILQNADFYLFDEPTNHLDLVAKDWFLEFLKNSKFGFMLVCHDRYFLDNLCSQIFELSLGKLKIYKGNYTKYLQQKEEDTKLLEKRIIEQQKFIKKQKEVIERFRAKATKAKMAQSMIKSLEKIDLIKPEQSQKIVRFNFFNTKRSGKIVLSVKDLDFSFKNKKIFQNVSFQIERGQKVAIVAPNGMGKTTLLNLISGKYDIQKGKIEFGYNVEVAVFEQDQNKSLNPKKTILQEVEDSCENSDARENVRKMLGAFLFSGEDVYKKISILSGGEKNRVAMVKVLLKNANFLILDEPTNHLDIESKEVLLNVLKHFSGTILFVSHDRSFLNNLATSILDLTPNGIEFYFGNYDSFLCQKKENCGFFKTSKMAKENKDSGFKSKNKQDYEKRKKIKNLESKISRLEKELEKVLKKFEILEYGTIEYEKIYTSVQDLEKQVKENLSLWEKMHD